MNIFIFIFPLLLGVLLATRQQLKGTYGTPALAVLLFIVFLYQCFKAWRKVQIRLIKRNLAVDASTYPFCQGETFELRDGRTLGYMTHGIKDTASAKRVVIYLHGTPGTRHEVFPDEKLLTDRGISLLAIDRPGFGKSTFDHQRTRLSFADDIAQLVQAKNIEQVAMIGFSGGGAYVLACVANPILKKRVVSATLIAAEGPYLEYPSSLLSAIRRDSPLLWITGVLLKYGCKFGREFMRLYFEHEQYLFFHNPRDFIIRKYGKRIGEKFEVKYPMDDATREKLAMYDMLIRVHGAIWHEPSQSVGVHASVKDCVIAKTAWEFPLEFIGDNTHICFWHGEKDVLRSVEVSKYMAKRMKNAKSVSTHWIPNAGHALFLRKDNWIQMLDEIESVHTTGPSNKKDD